MRERWYQMMASYLDIPFELLLTRPICWRGRAVWFKGFLSLSNHRDGARKQVSLWKKYIKVSLNIVSNFCWQRSSWPFGPLDPSTRQARIWSKLKLCFNTSWKFLTWRCFLSEVNTQCLFFSLFLLFFCQLSFWGRSPQHKFLHVFFLKRRRALSPGPGEALEALHHGKVRLWPLQALLGLFHPRSEDLSSLEATWFDLCTGVGTQHGRAERGSY